MLKVLKYFVLLVMSQLLVCAVAGIAAPMMWWAWNHGPLVQFGHINYGAAYWLCVVLAETASIFKLGISIKLPLTINAGEAPNATK
jgi:hypothetical protein